MRSTIVKKLWMFSVTLVAVCFVFAATAQTVSLAAGEKPTTWRIQTHWPLSSASFVPSAVWMKNEIEKRTDGRLIFELYNEGQLLPPKEIFNAVKRGMIEAGVSPPQYYGSQVPLAQIAAGLPFNFANTWEIAYYYKWMGFEDMMREACAKHGIYYATDRVYGTQIVTKRPTRTIEDFEGLKIRTTGTLAKYLTAIGGAAVYMPGGETYTGLASGVVEGASWGDMMGSESMGFFDLCDYLLWTPVNYAGTETWLISQKALDKLPDDVRLILLSLLEEHFWKRTNEHQWELAHFLPVYQEKYGFEAIEISPAEYDRLQEAAIPIWEDIAKLSPDCEKAVRMVIELNQSIGRLKNVKITE